MRRPAASRCARTTFGTAAVRRRLVRRRVQQPGDRTPPRHRQLRRRDLPRAPSAAVTRSARPRTWPVGTTSQRCSRLAAVLALEREREAVGSGKPSRRAPRRAALLQLVGAHARLRLSRVEGALLRPTASASRRSSEPAIFRLPAGRRPHGAASRRPPHPEGETALIPPRRSADPRVDLRHRRQRVRGGAGAGSSRLPRRRRSADGDHDLPPARSAKATRVT